MEIPKKPRITTIILILLLNSSILSGEQTIKIIKLNFYLFPQFHTSQKITLTNQFLCLLYFFLINKLPYQFVGTTLTPVRCLLLN